MLKRAHFKSKSLPYLLIAPQMLITLLFFYWPAVEALKQAFHLTDPFGITSLFVGLENFTALFESPEYRDSIGRTFLFSTLVCLLSLASGLILAVCTNRLSAGSKRRNTVQTLLLWPYAIAPAIAGVLWLFIFHPSYGAVGHFLNSKLDLGWNPILEGSHAMALVVIAAAWKQISYNFVFFLGGLQGISKSLLEAASLDGAGPIRRFFKIVLPLLSPTLFFLVSMNLVYAFFDTFGVIHVTTHGGPGGATSVLVYKAYAEGFIGQDLGSSAAQSAILMILTIAMMAVQFRVIEKRVQYGAK